MTTKDTDWRPGPTVCRCCLTEGCYKDISTEYFWMGKREVYSEMLAETLNLAIAYSQSGGPNSNSRLICEACISRLRDASDFKRQVVECEKTFMQHLDSGSVLETEIPVEQLDPEVKLETVKLEKRLSDDDDDFDVRVDFLDDDDDDLDDQPLTKLASKIPKKESVDLMDLLDNSKAAEKRKSSTKAKPPPPKKLKVKKEVPKPTASTAPKPEKKKKGKEEMPAEPFNIVWKRKPRLVEDKANAAIILEHSNAVVFRWYRGKFRCAYCPKDYGNVAEVRSHSVSHNKLQIFTNHKVRNSFPLRVDITDLACTLCNARKKDLTELKMHLKGEHNIKTNSEYSDGLIPFILTAKVFRCIVCEMIFENFMMLFIHMNKHFQSYICPTCGKGFCGKHKLRAHQKVHEVGPFKCLKCELVFSNRLTRKRHYDSVHQIVKDRYRCPICDLHTDSYHSRLRHMDKVHGQKTEYRCSMCPAVFGTGNLRYSHIRRVHNKKGSSRSSVKNRQVAIK